MTRWHTQVKLLQKTEVNSKCQIWSLQGKIESSPSLEMKSFTKGHRLFVQSTSLSQLMTMVTSALQNLCLMMARHVSYTSMHVCTYMYMKFKSLQLFMALEFKKSNYSNLTVKHWYTGTVSGTIDRLKKLDKVHHWSFCAKSHVSWTPLVGKMLVPNSQSFLRYVYDPLIFFFHFWRHISLKCIIWILGLKL